MAIFNSYVKLPEGILLGPFVEPKTHLVQSWSLQDTFPNSSQFHTFADLELPVRVLHAVLGLKHLGLDTINRKVSGESPASSSKQTRIYIYIYILPYMILYVYMSKNNISCHIILMSPLTMIILIQQMLVSITKQSPMNRRSIGSHVRSIFGGIRRSSLVGGAITILKNIPGFHSIWDNIWF